MKRLSFVIVSMLFLSVGCKKYTHEITVEGPIKVPQKDTALVYIDHVETSKATDRDGDYYKDVFYIVNRNNLKFVETQLTLAAEAGIFPPAPYEESIGHHTLTIFRRNKNVSYELQLYWKKTATELYPVKYSFKSKGE